MLREQQETLLHKVTGNNNLSTPYSPYIDMDSFPVQNTDLIGTIMNMMCHDQRILRAACDDNSPDAFDYPYYFPVECKVLRYDIEEPYVGIFVSTDYKYILVGDTTKLEDPKYACVYPSQLNCYSGIDGFTMYHNIQKDDNILLDHDLAYRAITLRVDNGEPCYSVIMEYVEGNKVRFVLGDEALMKCIKYYQPVLPEEPDTDNEEDTPESISVKPAKINKIKSKIILQDGVPTYTKSNIDPTDYSDVYNHEHFEEIPSFIEEYDMNRHEELIIAIRKELLEGVEIWQSSL